MKTHIALTPVVSHNSFFHSEYLLIRFWLNAQTACIRVVKQNDNEEKHADENA